jgi:hypothetical protein
MKCEGGRWCVGRKRVFEFFCIPNRIQLVAEN